METDDIPGLQPTATSRSSNTRRWLLFIITLFLIMASVEVVALYGYPRSRGPNPPGSTPLGVDHPTPFGKAANDSAIAPIPADWLTYQGPTLALKYPPRWNIRGDLESSVFHLDSQSDAFHISIGKWKCTSLSDCTSSDEWILGTKRQSSVSGRPAVRGLVDASNGATRNPIPIGEVDVMLNGNTSLWITYQPIDSTEMPVLEAIIQTIRLMP
jgi:hypothetical protein